MTDCSQITQGGAKVKHQCQSTIVGGACLCDVTPPRIWEWIDLRNGILFIGIKKKNSGWISIIIGWMCTNTANTHLCSNNMWKWILHPFNIYITCIKHILLAGEMSWKHAIMTGAKRQIYGKVVLKLIFLTVNSDWMRCVFSVCNALTPAANERRGVEVLLLSLLTCQHTSCSSWHWG